MPDIDLTQLSRDAWTALRSESQPTFDDLEESYRQRLLERAQRVHDTGIVTVEGTILDTFEQNVMETLNPERFHPLAVKDELVAEAVEPKGPLPPDFPAHDKLHEAGINTYTQLAKCEDLSELDGIGPATVKLITKRVKADTKALNK